MIYMTGDTHGRFGRFTLGNFPEQVEMTKDDFVIICGDFGGLWDGHKAERRRLDRLESLPFTLLFVSGNHENFDLLLLRGMAGSFRVKHRTWWEEELPSPEEYETAKRSLERAGHRVDYIITHCAPSTVVDELGSGKKFEHDALTDYLEEVRRTTAFRHWFFGHYHDNRKMDGHFVLLWDQIIRLL